MYSVLEIAERIRLADPNDISGLGPDLIREVQEAWGLPQLPATYIDFLSTMGAGAGRLLRGTSAFYPRILGLPESVAEFFRSNARWLQLPDGAQVFAMHQGYQVYWMSDISVGDPEVVFYMEEEAEPLGVWPTFTEFLGAQYLSDYGSR